MFHLLKLTFHPGFATLYDVKSKKIDLLAGAEE